MQRPRIRFDQKLSVLMCILSAFLFGFQKSTSQGMNHSLIQIIEKRQIVVPEVESTIPLPQISAVSAIVLDEGSAMTLFERQADTQFPPASTTKLMTALIARKLYQLDTAISVPGIVSAIDGTRIGLVPGERISIESLLQGTLIQSGNDAAITLAYGHPEGVEGFVSDMNAMAVELHLKNTHFTNAIGYDALSHLSSSRDLALLSRQAMLDPVLRRMVGTVRTTVTDTTGATAHELQSTHKLLGVDPSVIGVKTGTTEDAGEVLITQFELNGQYILIVVMGSKDRYSDTRALMEYVKQAVLWKQVVL